MKETVNLEGFYDENITKKGYWFSPSTYHSFVITVEKEDSGNNILARALEVDISQVESRDLSKIENGTPVNFTYCTSEENDWWIELNIYPKYYFPKFNEDKNQWYHKHYPSDHDFIDDFTRVLIATYEIAMKESKLEIY